MNIVHTKNSDPELVLNPKNFRITINERNHPFCDSHENEDLRSKDVTNGDGTAMEINDAKTQL